MTSKRIAEAGTLTAEDDGSISVILIEEGPGNSADYVRDFFTQENADALADSLSFPRHPEDLSKPWHRPSTDAIGSIDKSVTLHESEDGKMQMKSRFHPAKSKPEIGPYIKEYGHKLGLSIYIDSDGEDDPITGRYVPTILKAEDPYKSVDVVIAPGARGKFEKLSESLGLLPDTSAPAGGNNNKEIEMTKEIEDAVTAAVRPLAEAVGNLVTTLTSQKVAEATATAQATVDQEAVDAAVKARVDNLQKAEVAITAAKLGESASADLRNRALAGEDVTEAIAFAGKVLTEAKATPAGGRTLAESYTGGNDGSGDLMFEVPGFGQVRA